MRDDFPSFRSIPGVESRLAAASLARIAIDFYAQPPKQTDGGGSYLRKQLVNQTC
jgi:hypothetical protein